MLWPYFWILVVACTATVLVGLVRPERIFEYPYFMAVVFLVFLAPQGYSLIHFPGAASDEGIGDTLLMCSLCFAACWLGYVFRPIPRLRTFLCRPMHEDRVFYGGLLFIACGYFFNHLIGQMDPEEMGGSTWTGRVTIYAFFEQLIYPGFAIALLTALRTNSLFAWLAAIAGAVPSIQAVIFGGRREYCVQLGITLVLTLFYYRRFVPPRLLIVAAIFFCLLGIPATGTYRHFAVENDWSELREIDLIGNFDDFVNNESILELRNAALIIQATQKHDSYEYGRGYWDDMVFRFVPAQLLGENFKNGLMFDPMNGRLRYELEEFGYEMPGGSTTTGVGDAFRQFGWYGALFFAVVGYLFKNGYQATLERDAIFPQVFYISLLTSAMRSLTHETIDFLPNLTYYSIFLGLLYLVARKSAQEIAATPVAAPGPAVAATRPGRRPRAFARRRAWPT